MGTYPDETMQKLGRMPEWLDRQNIFKHMFAVVRPRFRPIVLRTYTYAGFDEDLDFV